jgi:hypothetical protein
LSVIGSLVAFKNKMGELPALVRLENRARDFQAPRLDAFALLDPAFL